MDRNKAFPGLLVGCINVALRKESVDRNHAADISTRREAVALRKESVDRNYIIKITRNTPAASLSARRAWIEIIHFFHKKGQAKVALRKESVDRNHYRKR